MRMKGLLLVVISGLLLSSCEMPDIDTKVFHDMGEARKFQRYCVKKLKGRPVITTSEALGTVTITCRS